MIGESGTDKWGDWTLGTLRIGDIHVDSAFAQYCPAVQEGGKYRYIRNGINWLKVDQYARALRAGVRLPPIVASPDAHLIEGHHRTFAYAKVNGPNSVIEVVLRDCSTRDAFCLATAENNNQGLGLERTDITKITILAEQLGVSDEELATLLSVPQDYVQNLKGPRAFVIGPNGSSAIALKPWMRFRENEIIPERDYRVMRGIAGTNPREMARSIRDCVSINAIDPNHSPTHTMLQDMAQAVLRDQLRLGLIDWSTETSMGFVDIARTIFRQWSEYQAKQAAAAVVLPVAASVA